MEEDRSSAPTFLRHEGEMSQLLEAYPWHAHPLGVPRHWPQSLKTVVSLCLHSRFPMLIWWGRQLYMLYNDAYRKLLGSEKHPGALGQAGAECWPEIWHIIGPMLQGVLDAGAATWAADQLLTLDRNGFSEECYFTFSYSPIHDESGGVGGVFTAVTETTERVLHERRLETLRKLHDAMSEQASEHQVLEAAMRTLASEPRDFDWVSCWEVRNGSTTRVCGADNLDSALRGEVEYALTVALATAKQQHLFFAQPRAQGGKQLVVVQPISVAAEDIPRRCLVVAQTAWRTQDDLFLRHVGMASGFVGSALDRVVSYEVQRRRAAALADLDRAKSTFFANVSHELRTPLTLMLAPLEDYISAHAPTQGLQELETIRRNALRLRKLVNELLSFSKIEAGAVRANLQATDLAEATVDIASLFRSGIEAAGLRFDVNVEALGAAVMVDRDMYEKVVTNLLSNALKYTQQGRIELRLRQVADQALLEVQDTGVGIPAADLPRVFDRFFRANEGRGRTEEGAGIGLALVKELVHLHGGSIAVSSQDGGGSTFSVRLPLRTLFAPAGHKVDPWRTTASGPEVPARPSGEPEPPAGERPLVLVADDNADMRAYIRRILEARYRVIEAGDGAQAADMVARAPPDLLVCDVMMPKLDGLSLVKQLRSSERTRSLPVIILSARAGEEASVEGLRAGADDYLVKPFTSRELQARADNLLLQSRLRQVDQRMTRRLLDVLAQAPVGLAVTSGQEHAYEYVNAAYQGFFPDRQLLSRTLRENFPELAAQGVYELFDAAYRTGERQVLSNHSVQLQSPDNGLETRVFNAVIEPLRDLLGEVTGLAIVVVDVTEVTRAKEEAVAANRAKDQFMAMLGHELRNPLAPIVTALQVMKIRHPQVAEKERSMIERQVAQMVRLVDDLLDIARITSGKVQLRMEVLELSPIISKALETTSHLFERNRHALVADVPASGLRVRGDADRLTQVICNLLTNAARYTPEGGRISVKAGASSNRVLVEVTDTGIGLAPDDIARIFDAFVQTGRRTEHGQGGLGLGLAIARSLASMHGGNLRAASAGVGKGSTFILELPLVREASGSKGGSALVASTPRGNGRRVLIVDDNEDAAHSLASLLSGWGFEPSVAHDGLQALVLARHAEFAVALLDIGLPLMDGYELAHALQRLPRKTALKLIALTGFGQEADARRAKEAGFAAHLVKPVALERLAQLLG